MNTKPQTEGMNPLLDQLARLETALDEPPVPGEIRNWATTVRKSIEETGRVFVQQLEQSHAPQLQEIEGQDPELTARVKALREEDCRNREWYDRVLKSIVELEANAVRAGADEKQVVEPQQKFMEDGLSFVVHARKQEVAIRSWAQESFARDTGFGD